MAKLSFEEWKMAGKPSSSSQTSNTAKSSKTNSKNYTTKTSSETSKPLSFEEWKAAGSPKSKADAQPQISNTYTKQANSEPYQDRFSQKRAALDEEAKTLNARLAELSRIPQYDENGNQIKSAEQIAEQTAAENRLKEIEAERADSYSYGQKIRRAELEKQQQAAMDKLSALETESAWAINPDLEADVRKRKEAAQAELDKVRTELNNLDASKVDYRGQERVVNTARGFGGQWASGQANTVGTLVAGGNALQDASSAEDRAINDSLYSGWVTDDLSKANFVDAGPQSAGILEENKAVEKKVTDFADKLAEDSAMHIAQAKQGLGTGGQLAVDLAGQAIQMGLDAATGVSTASMLSRSFGSGAQQARQEGATLGEQLAYGALSSATEVLTEKLFDGLAGIYGKGAADDLVRNVIGKMADDKTGQIALRILASSGGEALEETISGLLDPLYQKIYNDKTYRENLDVSELLYSALVGGILGGVGGVANVDTYRFDDANAQGTTTVQDASTTQGDIQTPPTTAETSAGQSGELNSQANAGTKGDIDPIEIIMGISAPNKKTTPVGMEESTAVNTDPAQHTPVEQAVIMGNKKTGAAQTAHAEALRVTSETKNVQSPVVEAPASTDSISQVPGNSNPNLVERGYGKNVRTDANMEEVLRNDLEANKLLYSQLANKDTLEKAGDVFKQGYTQATKTIFEAVANAKNGGKLPPEMVPLSRMVANEMARRGDVEGARQLIADVASELTAAGQLGNAAKLMRNPLEALNAVKRMVQTINSEVNKPIKKGTVVVAKDRGNFGKIIGFKDGAYQVQFTSKDGVSRVIEMSRDDFYVADAKQRGKSKGKGKSESATSQDGNIYVTGWAEQIGRNLAEKFTAANGKTSPTVTQQIEGDISAMVKKLVGGSLAVGPVEAKADPKLAQIEKLSNVVNNAEFYNQALEGARILLADKYGVPRENLDSILGEWANQSIEAITISKINEALQKELGEDAKRGSWVARLTPEEEQRILNTDFTQEGAFEAIYDQIATRLGREMPATVREKMRELRKTGMLLNPKTQLKNVFGNVPMALERKAADTLSGFLQDLAVKTGLMNEEDRTRAAIAGKDFRGVSQDYFNAHKDEILNAGESKTGLKGALKEHRTYFNKGLVQKGIEKIAGKQLDDSALDILRKTTYSALQAGDAPFVKSAFVDSLAQYCAAHNITDMNNLPSEAIEHAIADANAATFKSASALAQLLNKAKQLPVFGEALDIIVPFTTTPINIATQFAQYSPLGIANMVYKGVTHKGAAEIIDAASKTLTGSAVIGLGMVLRSLGLITGGADDDKDKAALDKATGQAPFSFGGKYSYDWMQPVGSQLAWGAELMDVISQKDLPLADKILQGIIASGDAYLQQSFFSTLLDLLQGNGSPTENLLEALVTNSASQFVPSLAGAIARTIDPTVRTSYTGEGMVADILASVKAKTPGLSQDLAESVDVRGNAVDRGNLAQRILDNFISPGNANRGERTAADEAIYSLYEETGDKTIFPQVSPYKVDYEGGYTLTGEERETFQKTQANVYYKELDSMIKSGQWETLDSDAQIKVLQKLNSFALDSAKRELVSSRGDRYTSDYDEVSKLRNPGEYVSAKAIYDSDLKTKNYSGIDAMLDIYNRYQPATRALLEEKIPDLEELLSIKNVVDAQSYFDVADRRRAIKKATGTDDGKTKLTAIGKANLAEKEEETMVGLLLGKEGQAAYHAFTDTGYSLEDAVKFLGLSGSNKDGTASKKEQKAYVRETFGSDWDEIWEILYPKG